MTAQRTWIVLIADLRGSKTFERERRSAVDRALDAAVRRTVRRFGDAFRLEPEQLRGDELQAVLRPAAPALAVLTHLRGHLATAGPEAPALRAGLGSGPVERLSTKGPFASDGAAFHRARAALEHAKSGGSRLTAWRTGVDRFDSLSDAMLALADVLTARWTRPQWEAIVGRLEDKGLEGIARERGVSFQSVSKRLRAASWNEVAAVYTAVEAAAREALQPGEVETADSAARGRR